MLKIVIDAANPTVEELIVAMDEAKNTLNKHLSDALRKRYEKQALEGEGSGQSFTDYVNGLVTPLEAASEVCWVGNTRHNQAVRITSV